MKTVVLNAPYEAGGTKLYPGTAVVSDALATTLAGLSLLTGSAIDFRSPNPADKLVFRGAYNIATAYVIGDVVTEGGSTFVATAASVGESTADTDFFSPLALGGSTEMSDFLTAVPVTHLALLGSTTNLTALVPAIATISASGVTLTTAGGNTYSDASTKTAIDGAADALAAKVITALGLKADNVDVETLRTEIEARLDALDAKADAIIGKLITAKIMAAS